MRRHQISKVKMNALRTAFIKGEFRSHLLARELKVSSITTWRYLKEFERIKADYPERLTEMDFYITDPPRTHRETPMYIQLMNHLPQLVSAEQPGTKAKPVWRKFHVLCPEGYTYYPFKTIYYKYVSEQVTAKVPNLIEFISAEDQKRLTTWRHGNNHRRWQIVTTLRAALAGRNITQIADKADCQRKSANDWIKTFKVKGLSGFDLKKRKPDVNVVRRMADRRENLMKLLHQTPKLYGLNRTSWTILALTEVYNLIYPNKPVSYMQLSLSLKQMGYSYKKSRDMLTSQDPDFRKKIAHIQTILHQLKPNEKFFSIDEYGPVGIRLKGGRTLRTDIEGQAIIPEKQKNKGYVICTAALELSTNQVTHFYSLKKNTFEMIKLIDLLKVQYAGQERLYLCWDAVSWHNSKILKTYIEDHNAITLPKIIIAPLPSCTQFLNVIESVFCGLAKAVIHNSDYACLDDCKAAIDQHFETRNNYFSLNPKRAGNKIWGKEQVKAKFSETHVTRNRNSMRGASNKDKN
ncbi:transposase [Mucilaginibacter sp. UYP27]